MLKIEPRATGVQQIYFFAVIYGILWVLAQVQ